MPTMQWRSFGKLLILESSRQKYMEKEYQTPVAEVVILNIDRSILESSLNGSRNNYTNPVEGWED